MYQHSTSILYKKEPTHVSFAIHPTPKGVGFLALRFCNKQKLSFAWCKDFFKIGSVSGLESFVRNIAYMLMVSRMVNVVGESGVYWVANNFIWDGCFCLYCSLEN